MNPTHQKPRPSTIPYTWGTKGFTHSLWIKNSQLKITSNLFEALRHLRDKEKTRTLWIDAICVNQGDLKERSKQVRSMDKIYSNVCHVIIWLGKEAEGGDSSLCNLFKVVEGLTAAEVRAASRALFRQPWWFRSWTVQEFLNSKSCTFLYGSIKLSWKDITRMMESWEITSDGVIQDSSLYQYVRSKNSHKSDLLRTVMIDFGHCKASDPRDKVYAFLGIAIDSDKIMPDYEALVQQVYTDIVKAYIKNEGNLEIICTHHRGQSLISLPSWVPDWSISRSPTQNWTVNTHGQSFYSAGYPRQYSSDLPLLNYPSVNGISFEDMHTLKGAGIPIGLISRMACSIDPRLFDTNQWIRAILSWKAEAIDSGEYMNKETNFLAFCRTLIGDVCGGIMRVTSSRSGFLREVEGAFRTVFENYSDPVNPDLQKVPKFLRWHVQRAIPCLKFARISSGYMALVPDASEVGDEICILLGSSTPMVMRRELCPSPTSQGSPANNSMREEGFPVHRMIGPCYVYGVMDGEMSGEISKSFVIR